MILNIMLRTVLLLFRSMTLNGCTIPKFKLNGIILHVVAPYKYLGHTYLQMIILMMRISIENVEQYLFKGILYCDSFVCATWV